MIVRKFSSDGSVTISVDTPTVSLWYSDVISSAIERADVGDEEPEQRSRQRQAEAQRGAPREEPSQPPAGRASEGRVVADPALVRHVRLRSDQPFTSVHAATHSE